MGSLLSPRRPGHSSLPPDLSYDLRPARAALLGSGSRARGAEEPPRGLGHGSPTWPTQQPGRCSCGPHRPAGQSSAVARSRVRSRAGRPRCGGLGQHRPPCKDGREAFAPHPLLTLTGKGSLQARAPRADAGLWPAHPGPVSALPYRASQLPVQVFPSIKWGTEDPSLWQAWTR